MNMIFAAYLPQKNRCVTHKCHKKKGVAPLYNLVPQTGHLVALGDTLAPQLGHDEPDLPALDTLCFDVLLNVLAYALKKLLAIFVVSNLPILFLLPSDVLTDPLLDVVLPL